MPGKAVINAATNPAPGTVRLDYECSGATSFDIFMQAPGSPDFVLVAEDLIVKFYEIKGLTPSTPPDVYSFYVRGRNSRGFGEDSDTTSLEVT